MPKRILVLADGTGNEGGLLPDESRTNVYKLYRATRNDPESTIDPARQIAFYVAGIGTPIVGHTGTWRTIRETADKMLGGGITGKIIDCYLAVVSSWRPGDSVYLFGFSRGAYTARCVAHLLEIVGIPTRQAGGEALSFAPTDLRRIAKEAAAILFRFGLELPPSDERAATADAFRRRYGCETGRGVVPYFIGVWDTVAAIGIERFVKAGYDRHLPRDVMFVRHAMAIDEYRKDFARVPWGRTIRLRQPGEPEPFEQVWFAGDHSDIGGSYPEQESRLSDISLKWMADFIAEGLPVEGRIQIDDRFLHLHPSADGMMHDELMVGMGGTPLRWYPADRDVPVDADLHASVYERLALSEVRNFTSYGKYRPATLRNHARASGFFDERQDGPTASLAVAPSGQP
ncbi:DUF2235 domain-containing protein [Beijerinckia sp. L45]|uniref:DUF2235 domain-containing protein n=1 Tax=Beijerinckia sp. L45 TaxID=1641855 RepID=UPI00131D31BB|nr:DUF2235 domain-containing protein [Beijerinckia sp. L45]